MPTYLYSDEAQSTTIARTFRIGQAPKRVRHEGVTFWRDIAAEHSDGPRVADPWTKHYSFGMGARTDRHADEIGKKCAAAGLDCTFDKHLRLKVNSKEHQRKLMKVVLGPEYRNRDSYCG